jgi:hypothetical protein
MRSLVDRKRPPDAPDVEAMGLLFLLLLFESTNGRLWHHVSDSQELYRLPGRPRVSEKSIFVESFRGTEGGEVP